MPSILPGFEYDVFISYRHKDNKGDRWVTEFVEALKTELESTFKEDISIYFDTNPHDGLLETHNVDKSLEGKLRCVIFIPIISQTYCDPKSFAWQHEFCAFNKIAKEDQVGRDIKLANGNVASRILPVKIHDLDAEDKSTIEAEIGGILRPVEFIYKEAGVNRPLKPTDNKIDNLNKTDYRNQINKVANAVKEIITALKSRSVPGPPTPHNRPSDHQPMAPSGNHKKKVAFIAATVLILLVAVFFLYPKFISAETENLGNSIAVLYFDNISSDPDQDYFSDGITEEITAHLSSIKGLRVTSRTSVIPFKGKGQAINIRDIAKQLNVTNVLEGSVRKSGDKLRITAQLIDARTDQHVWTEVYDRNLTDVFKIQSEIAQAIANKFKIAISSDANAKIEATPTTNMKAYELYLKARSIPWGTGDGIGSYYGGRYQAMKLLKEAIALDPDFSWPYVLFSRIYFDFRKLDSAAFFAKEAIIRNPKSADGFIALAETQDFDEGIKLLRKAYPLDSARVLISMARHYYFTGRFASAIKVCSYLIQSDPNMVQAYIKKAEVYSHMAQVDSVRKYLRFAKQLDPNNKEIYHAEFQVYLDNGQIQATQEAATRYFGDDTLSINKEVGIACIMAKDWKQAYYYYSRTAYRDMDWGLVLLKLGRKEEGMKTLRESLAYRSKITGWLGDYSRINILLGNKALGIDYFKKLVAARDVPLMFMRNDPYWDEVRQDPEFKKLAADYENTIAAELGQIKADERKEFSLDL